MRGHDFGREEFSGLLYTLRRVFVLAAEVFEVLRGKRAEWIREEASRHILHHPEREAPEPALPPERLEPEEEREERELLCAGRLEDALLKLRAEAE